MTRLTDEDLHLIKIQYAMGKSVASIAANYPGLSYVAVWKRVKDLELAPLTMKQLSEIVDTEELLAQSRIQYYWNMLITAKKALKEMGESAC